MDSYNSQLLISDTGAAMFDVDAKEMKEKRGKNNTTLEGAATMHLESSWVNVEELEISFYSGDGNFALTGRNAINQTDGNSTTIL